MKAELYREAFNREIPSGAVDVGKSSCTNQDSLLNSFEDSGVATPRWYKCQNSQHAQKCLGRVRCAEGVFGPLGRELQSSLLHGVKPCFMCETGFARCERLFWDSQPRDTK